MSTLLWTVYSCLLNLKNNKVVQLPEKKALENQKISEKWKNFFTLKCAYFTIPRLFLTCDPKNYKHYMGWKTSKIMKRSIKTFINFRKVWIFYRYYNFVCLQQIMRSCENEFFKLIYQLSFTKIFISCIHFRKFTKSFRYLWFSNFSASSHPSRMSDVKNDQKIVKYRLFYIKKQHLRLASNEI